MSMRGARRQRREDAEALAAAIADARRARRCEVCTGVFAGSAAFAVHRDPVTGCLPAGAFGQLELVDGVWRLLGPAGR